MQAFVVDAFTDVAFRGNPAGVVLVDDTVDHPVDDEWMQLVAREFNHSETAFVRRRDDSGYDLRWFTPSVEVDLCGHATLATAHVLAGSGAQGPFTFHTRSGELIASVDDGGITLDFPAMTTTRIAVPDGLEQALGVPVDEVRGNGIDVMVVLDDAATVESLRPDVGLLRGVPCRGVIVTAPAVVGADHDFVSRFFAVLVGVDEDPVTGSAHCALAPYWAQRLGREALTGVQVSQRPGRVGVRIHGTRVRLSGRARTVLRGELLA